MGEAGKCEIQTPRSRPVKAVTQRGWLIICGTKFDSVALTKKDAAIKYAHHLGLNWREAEKRFGDRAVRVEIRTLPTKRKAGK